MQSVDESIKKAKANLAITQSQDAVSLLKTRYDVRRAELDVQRNPVIDAIDAKKNILTLDQSKRALDPARVRRQGAQEQADSQLAVFHETAQPQPDRRRPGNAAHRPDQVAGADHGAGGDPPESRRLLQFRTADAGHPRRRHAAARHAGGRHTRSCPNWKYGPRSASWIAPT